MKTNLYAIAKRTEHVGEKVWLTQGKKYKVQKIISRSCTLYAVVVDDLGDLSEWNKALFTYEEA